MNALTDKIYQQALNLPTEERLCLVDLLLKSSNYPSSQKIETAWYEEARFRSKQLDVGKAKLIPGDKVFKEIKEKFQF